MPKRRRVEETSAEEAQSSAPRIAEAHDLETAVGANGAVATTPQRRTSKRQKTGYQEIEASVARRTTPAKRSRKSGPQEPYVKEEQIVAQTEHTRNRTPKKGQSSKPIEASNENETRVAVDVKTEPTIKRKRKTKEEKEAEAMPLATRTIGHKLFIGAHVSSAGGVPNSVANSVHIGANAFALFLKSQRKWANPPLAEEHCASFLDNCSKHSYDQAKHVVPHGSYLVNLAHTDETRTEQAYSSFLDDLQRCERLGIRLYNFHPGVANSVGDDRPAAIRHLAGNINRAHKETSTVVTLLENMAAGGNVLGSTFEDLRDIITLIEDRSRIGVCLDTCHAFAGGYDLRSPAAFMQTMGHFDATVGFQYLYAVHMNDSKAPLASHRDLHANIGTGFLGLRAFHNLVNDARFEGLPLVLETPIEVKDDLGVPLKDDKGRDREDKAIWAGEIKLLESLVGMDVEGEEFAKLEATLARKGEIERARLTEQIERKRQKEESKRARAVKKKGGSRKHDESEEEDDPDGGD